MANYVLVYHGGSMPESPEEGAKVMQAWTDWFGTLGGAWSTAATRLRHQDDRADGSVSDDAERTVGLLDHQGRFARRGRALAKGCPVLPGGASIQVVETFEAM